MFLLLNLEKVLSEASANNLTTLILRSSVEYGGLTIEQIANKLVCFDLNGVAMFIDLHANIVIFLKLNFARLLTLMHCMGH
jgi:hypothetical protein